MLEVKTFRATSGGMIVFLYDDAGNFFTLI